MKLQKISLPNIGTGVNLINTGSLALEFKRRLDAYFAYYNVVGKGKGYRSIEAQIIAYMDYKADPANHNPAAFPGNSWHNCGLADDIQRDVTGHYPATMEADYLLAPANQQLGRWGLCIPMWKNTAEKEPWHVTPVECLGITQERQWFLDEDDLLDTPSGYRSLHAVKMPDAWTGDAVYMEGNDVLRCQRAVQTDLQDGHFGEMTEQDVIDFQAVKGLTVDGQVGSQTWAAIADVLNPPPPINYKDLYELEKSKNVELSMQIDGLQTTISGLQSEVVLLNEKIDGLNVEVEALKQSKAELDQLKAALHISNGY